MTTAELLYACETDILVAIAELLGKGRFDSANWKIEKLAKLGAISEKSLRIIREYRDAIQSGASDEVEKAAFEATMKTEKAALEAKRHGAAVNDVLPEALDSKIKETISVWQRSAVNSMNGAMSSMASRAGGVYVDAINKASLSVVTGASSGREALIRAVKEWAEVGIPSFTDKAGRQWTTEAYANMVIRTNTRKVTTEVQMERAQEFGADLIEVSAHAGARPLCEPYQGKIFSLSGKSEKYPAFSSTSYGEPAGLFGINCVLGNTLVSGSGKRAIYRRKYSGEIVVIRTAGGHELSVTPNHPILTENGWIAAGLLKNGDYVISRAGFDGKNGASPNPNHDVARIEDVFNSLIKSGDVFRLPASSGYFHGDVSDGDIDIVLPHGFLNDGGESSFYEHGVKDLLGFTAESSNGLASVGAFDQVAFSPNHTPNGVMGGSGISSAPVGSGPILGKARCLGPVDGKRDAQSSEVLTDSPFGNSSFCRDLILPHAGIVHSKEVGGANASLSLQESIPVSAIGQDSMSFEAVKNCLERASVFLPDSGCGNPGSVKLDNIIFIERKSPQSSFVHVYNLQTESGWFYANNIITHNCGHVQYPFFEGISRQTYAPTKDKAENDEAYKASQKQRAYERAIRSAKRELKVMEALGDEKEIAKAKGLVKDRQAAMKAFIQETKRTRRSEREQIYD